MNSAHMRQSRPLSSGFGTDKTVICSSELGTWETPMHDAIEVCDTDPKVGPLSGGLGTYKTVRARYKTVKATCREDKTPKISSEAHKKH